MDTVCWEDSDKCESLKMIRCRYTKMNKELNMDWSMLYLTTFLKDCIQLLWKRTSQTKTICRNSIQRSTIKLFSIALIVFSINLDHITPLVLSLVIQMALLSIGTLLKRLWLTILLTRIILMRSLKRQWRRFFSKPRVCAD